MKRRTGSPAWHMPTKTKSETKREAQRARLQAMTVAQLRALAGKKGVAWATRDRKSDLIDKLSQ